MALTIFQLGSPSEVMIEEVLVRLVRNRFTD